METSITEHGNGQQLPAVVETATAAAAAREKAAVESRYVMALRQPRDLDVVRQKLLAECRRPGFADVATYAKPVGNQTVKGLSIRFAEAAIRHYRNVLVQVAVVFDDVERRIIHVSVIDLEGNATYGDDVILVKTVERRKPREGQEILGQRLNSTGEPVYLIRATEDDFQNKQNAAISKAIRNFGLRLIPGDILDECRGVIDQVKRDRAAADPAAEKKKILDAFAGIGVSADRIKGYLGHPLEELAPAELVNLRELYEAIRDGETTWSAIMAERAGEDTGPAAAATRAPRKSARQPQGDQKADAGSEGERSPVDRRPDDATAAVPSAEGQSGGSNAAPAGGDSRPPTQADSRGDKLTPKTFGSVFAAIKPYDAKHGQGKANGLLQKEFQTPSVTDLTEQQAQRFIALLKQ